MRLEGVAPIPLAGYLKGLGVLRAVSYSADTGARAWWDTERMELDTTLDTYGLLEALTSYPPTPALTPWSMDKHVKCVDILKPLLQDPRLVRMSKAVDMVEKRVLPELADRLGVECGPGLDNMVVRLSPLIKKKGDSVEESKKKEKNKEALLRIYRGVMPDDALEWLDASMALVGRRGNASGFRTAPLCFTGGNDGNFDMCENFASNLSCAYGDDRSDEWLKAALFGAQTRLVGGKNVGHDPRATGDDALLNPWDYILMMEGIMVLAGSVGRRHTLGPRTASFPFTASYTRQAREGSDVDYGELWMPVWVKPATYRELRRFLGLGRMDVRGRQGATGADFARAARSLGSAYGVTEFRRFVLLKRNGKMHVSVPKGVVHTDGFDSARLMDELDAWRTGLPRDKSNRRRVLENALDAAVLDAVKRGTPYYIQKVMSIAADLDMHSGADRRLGLNGRWFTASNDGSAEFRLAASLAGIGQGGSGLRFWQYVWPGAKCVWTPGAPVVRNMKRAVLRLAVDAAILGATAEHTDRHGQHVRSIGFPVKSVVRVHTSDVAKFLLGVLDEPKLEMLIRALMPVSLDRTVWDMKEDAAHLPEAYVVVRGAMTACGRLDLPILHTLSAGAVGRACTRACGLLAARDIRFRRGALAGTTVSGIVAERLAASMLFDVGDML